MKEWLRRVRFCVTGGAGAMGSRLVKQLIRRGACHIVVFDQHIALSKRNAFREASVQCLAGSILEEPDLERAFSQCTVVFHLAALTHVGRSQIEPVRYLEVNGLGTARVLEACRRQGVQHVIYTSTSHVYGLPRQLPVHEEHPTRPLSVYAASKLAGEAAVQGYAASYGLSATIARLSNLYGASFGVDTVIGLALQQVVSGGPIALRNLAPVRDFIHADDVVEALVRLAVVGDGWSGCRIVNVSTSRGVSVRDMVETLARIAAEQGLGLPEIIQTGNSQSELVPKLILDNSRLRELTGWTPQISLEQGLRLALQELQRQDSER